MRLTADQAVRETPVSEKGVPAWANEELLPLLRQLRNAANACAVERSTVTTGGGGAYARLWTSPVMPTDSTWHVEALVAGTDSASGGAQHAGYAMAATFASQAGVVAQVGSTTALASHESAAGIDARFGVDASERVVYLEVRDAGAAAMNFVAVTQTTEARL